MKKRWRHVVAGALLASTLGLGACAGASERRQRISIPEVRHPPPASGRSTLLLPVSEDFCKEGLIEAETETETETKSAAPAPNEGARSPAGSPP